jgi:hypothetical protein
MAMFFEKMKGVHRNIGVQKDSKTLLLKTVQYFVASLAILALNFRKVLRGPKNFLLSKFGFG